MRRKFTVVVDVPAEHMGLSRSEMASYMLDAIAGWYGQFQPGDEYWGTMTNAKTKVSWYAPATGPDRQQFCMEESGYERARKEEKTAKKKRKLEAEMAERVGANSEAERLMKYADAIAGEEQ